MSGAIHPCLESVYSPGQFRSHRCNRPAKGMARIKPRETVTVWGYRCGIHLRRYAETRPLPPPETKP